MERKEIFRRTQEVLARLFAVPPDAIEEKTAAPDIARWDSFSHLVALGEIEREFSVKLPVLDAYAVQNVGQLVGLVAQVATRQRHAAG